MDISLREEQPGDETAIHDLTREAFAGKAFSDQTEHLIVDALRVAGALSLSLVATLEDRIVGHVAFSKVAMSKGSEGWYALGPISVAPDLQGKGIGGRLVREGLSRIRDVGAVGCVLAGAPGYYGRFGFRHDPSVELEGIPAEASLVLRLVPNDDAGFVRFDKAFSTGSHRP